MKVTSRKKNEHKNIYLLRLFVEKYMPTRSKLSFPSKTLFIYKPQIHMFGLFTFYRRCFSAVLEGENINYQ
jgi:hypothetical protein